LGFWVFGIEQSVILHRRGKKDLRGFRNLAGLWDFGIEQSVILHRRGKKDLRGFRNLAGFWVFGTVRYFAPEREKKTCEVSKTSQVFGFLGQSVILHRRGIKKTCEVLETSQVFGIPETESLKNMDKKRHVRFQKPGRYLG